VSEQAALLSAICADPEDDTPRLAYADWLQENGDEDRAEFIRVQIELARFPAEDDAPEMAERRLELETRESRLFSAHRKAWEKEARLPRGGLLKGFEFWSEFERGFRDFPMGRVERFVGANADLFRHHPVGTFDVGGITPPALEQFLSLGWLSRIRSARFSYGGMYANDPGDEPPDWSPVFRSEALSGLRDLTLVRGSISAAKDTEGGLPALRTLAIQDWTRLGNAGRLANVVKNLPHDRLTSLEVGYGRWTPADYARLLDSPKLANLERLWVAPDGGGRKLLQRLGKCAFWPRLRAINLSWASGAAAKGLPDLPATANLRRVQLSASSMTELGTFAASPILRSVTSLSFLGAWAGADKLQTLLASPHLLNLSDLDLRYCDIGPDGAEVIANWPHATRLVHLNLSYCGIRKAGAAALAASPVLNRLKRLNVRGNNLLTASLEPLRRRFGDALVV
jgi:uncharacterized protein (TIGR02996 family)